MGDEAAEYRAPKWFRIVAISYVCIGFIFFLLFLGLILFSSEEQGGDPVVELEPGSFVSWVFGISGGLVFGFTVIGLPAMILMHYGLKNQNKYARYVLFAAAAAWVIYLSISLIRSELGG